jgi:cytochrome c peroxidase
VPAGPTGLAVDDREHRVVVFSQFDRKLSVIRPSGDEAIDERAALNEAHAFAIADSEAKALPESVALGRVLFHKAGDPRISADGRACASCHPDGRDDGLTWSTPRGPRRSIALAGRLAKTAPFAWDGKESEIRFHLDDTFSRLRGSGVHGSERDALVSYLESLPAPPKHALDSNKVRRGREIFMSAEAGCSSCHAGSALTDNALHDIGTRTRADRSGEFNTPSLKLLGNGGPYFHDGRYKSLHELLVSVDGKMGRTAHLGEADLDALETYLRSL